MTLLQRDIGGEAKIQPPRFALPGAARRRAANYDALTPTVFHEPWWLDIATGGQWGAVESFHEGSAVGRMPFFCRSKLWFQTSDMPTLTHFLGPAVDAGEGSASTRHLRRIAVTRDLIRQLPHIASFRQRMHRDIDDVVAFQMEEFASSVQFTYELEPAPTETLWRQMRDKTRNVVRKAQNAYVVDDATDAEEFVWLYRQNVLVKGWDEALDLDVAKQLLIASNERGCGEVLTARDEHGVAKAAILCVWDRTVCYYLLSTRTPDSGNGAIALLLWKAIQKAAERGLIFDFHGLGYHGAVLFYTGFGAEIRPRYVVSRVAPSLRLLREARRVIGKSDASFHD